MFCFNKLHELGMYYNRSAHETVPNFIALQASPLGPLSEFCVTVDDFTVDIKENECFVIYSKHDWKLHAGDLNIFNNALKIGKEINNLKDTICCLYRLNDLFTRYTNSRNNLPKEWVSFGTYKRSILNISKNSYLAIQ